MGSAPVPAPVRILYMITAVCWLVLEFRQSRHRRPEAVSSDQGSRHLLHASYVLGLVAALALRALAPSGDIHPVHLAAWFGLPVIWAGIALRLWSVRTLGRYFTFTVQTSVDQPVITNGPYRLIRHPSYAGMLCAFAGFGIAIGNWWSLLAFVGATACGVVRRIMVEEHALIAALGDPYRDYAATHKRLVPFVW